MRLNECGHFDMMEHQYDALKLPTLYPQETLRGSSDVSKCRFEKALMSVCADTKKAKTNKLSVRLVRRVDTLSAAAHRQALPNRHIRSDTEASARIEESH